MKLRALRPYGAYKDSAVEWIGRVPENWDLLPNRALFAEVDERDQPNEEMLSVTIARGVIRQADLLAQSSKKDSSNEDKSKYKLVSPGDLAYNKMRAWQGALGVSRGRGIVSPAYIVMRSTGRLHAEYAHHLMRTPPFAREAQRWSYGISSDQWSLRPEHFKLIYCPVPPGPEQRAIVRFVAHADRRIATYISAKRRLVELLEERKRAVTHYALIHGVRQARRVSSGFHWLGDIPSDWKVVRFKSEVGFQEGPGIMAADFREEGVPLLRISCLAGDTATLEGCNFLDPAMVTKRWSHFRVASGDYLLTASGSLGKVTLATKAVAGAVPYTGIIRLWPLGAINMEFVRLFLGSNLFAAQIALAKAGVGIEHFGPTHLKRMMIVLPSPEEQNAIVAHIHEEAAKVDAAIDRARREMTLLTEYRTRLVTDVVLGRLDVRAFANSLPKAESRDEAVMSTVTTGSDLDELLQEAPA